jgi:hypothetical protein
MKNIIEIKENYLNTINKYNNINMGILLNIN